MMNAPIEWRESTLGFPIDSGKSPKSQLHAHQAQTKRARIFLQMWHAGRQAHPANTGGVTPVAPSPLPRRP